MYVHTGHSDSDGKKSYLAVMPFMNRSKLLVCKSMCNMDHGNKKDP